MKRFIIMLLPVMMLFPRQSLKAQLKADDKGIFIKKGTLFSTDGLALIPSVDLSLTNVTVIKGEDPVSWPQYSSITRMYHFSSPVVFRGTMALSYLSSELNGNNPAALGMAYTAVTATRNYSDYTVSETSTANAGTRTVTQLFQNDVTVSDITAVTTGFIIPPVVASGSTSFCEGSSVTLGTVAASSWQWYKNGSPVQGANRKDLTVTESGDYAVQTVMANGFSTMSDAVTVTVTPLPQGSLAVEKETDISLGDQVTLIASGGTTYVWDSPDGIINGQNKDTLIVRPAKTTTYRVIIGNGSGCNDVKTIVINVKSDYKNLIANNIVTPNGDGVNDVWVVKDIDLYPNNEVKIVDRAGRIVYSKNGYDNTWDATYNGSPLPEDTYYYILYIDSGKKKLTGFISVVRE